MPQWSHSSMVSPKESSFHSVRRQKICIEIYSLLPATRPSYHSPNGSQQPLNLATVCVCERERDREREREHAGSCVALICVKIPLAPWVNFPSWFLPLRCMSYFLLPHLFSRSLDANSFYVTSQGCVPGRDPRLEGIQMALGCLSVVFVWFIWVMRIEAEKICNRRCLMEI